MLLDSVYRPIRLSVWVTVIAVCLVTNLKIGSGQLTKTDSCTCPEGVITYICVINGNSPGGFTIWQGTAFTDCQSNHILLRNNLFGTSGAFGSCNNGIISGRSLGVSAGNVYTSQLQVTITSGSRSDLIGRTVECVYSPDGSTNNLINSTTITITDPLPPPLDVQLTSVKPDKLTFNWSSVQQNCSTLQYGIESNCGTCTNDPPTLTSATCSFELSAISGGLCNFSVQSTVCGNITGSLSTPIRVTLKVPNSPVIQSVIPTYSDEDKLISIEVNFTDVESFNISSSINGSALYYIVNFIDSSTDVMCNSSNVSPSFCVQQSCIVPPVYLTACSQAGSINISVSAFNLLGNGPASYFSIGNINQYFNVMFETTERVVCSFLSQPGNQNLTLSNRSCKIAYGQCDQESSIIVQGVSDSSTTVVIDLQEQLLNGYCYTVTASNGTSTMKIQGVFNDEQFQGIRTVAIAVGVTVSLVLIILAFTIPISIIAVQRYRKIKGSGQQEVRRRLLNDEIDLADQVICAHIIFNLEDRPDELVEALRILSKNSVNIKNIKICPCDSDTSLRRVYVECDHNLEATDAEEIKNQTELGLPGTLEVYMKPESKIIKRNEDTNSKRGKEIEEVLRHEPGALCSLLEIFLEAEALHHISITDIIHEDVAERENCKRVIIKFIPELPRNWKENYNKRRNSCDFIVSMGDISNTLL